MAEVAVPDGKGEPGAGASAPVAASIVKAEMLEASFKPVFATNRNPPPGATTIDSGLTPTDVSPTAASAPLVGLTV